jgi:hypothetical protein
VPSAADFLRQSTQSRADYGNDEIRVVQQCGRRHEVVDAGKGKVRTAITMRGELRQPAGPETDQSLDR